MKIIEITSKDVREKTIEEIKEEVKEKLMENEM